MIRRTVSLAIPLVMTALVGAASTLPAQLRSDSTCYASRGRLPDTLILATPAQSRVVIARSDDLLSVEDGWNYYVARFAPNFRIDSLPFVPGFGDDGRGGTLMFQRVSFMDAGRSLADAPAVTFVHQYRGDRLADVTREQCDNLLGVRRDYHYSARFEWERATPARRAASKAASAPSADDEEMRSAVTQIALQQMVCGREADALLLLRETWPAAAVEARAAEIRQWAAYAVRRP